MLRSSHFRWGLMLCLSFSPLASGQEPRRLGADSGPVISATPIVTTNQQLADGIAHQLRQSAQLHHYHVNVNAIDGTVELTGHVSSQPQREEVLRIVQGVPGVIRVRDRLVLLGDSTVQQTQAAAPAPRTFQPPTTPPTPITRGTGNQFQMPEPTPIFSAPVPVSSVLPPPKMPPYAWPTYAPYNNYSRVGYPTAYPYKAWPFIGPFHPFPKVPLGWRKVTLEWEDGNWWYGRNATKKDWWRIRYW